MNSHVDNKSGIVIGAQRRSKTARVCSTLAKLLFGEIALQITFSQKESFAKTICNTIASNIIVFFFKLGKTVTFGKTANMVATVPFSC